jgi:DNA-3-methyladenine glycosylase II
MGDFVSKGKRAADGERPLSLFSCLDEEAAPIVRNGHKVINDFVFLADASLRDFALQAAHDVRLFADAVEQPAGCQFDLRKAEQYLKKADGRLCALIESLGPCEFSRTSEGLPALLDAIISQQLSGPAASVIRKRVYEVFGGGAVTPEVIAAVSDELLLSSGLSARKIDFVRNLSKAVASGEINFEKFNEMSDDEVMQALTSIKGIGRWSAQMYLLFSLGRPDVLPLSDVALQTAFKSVYLLKDEEVPGRAEEIAEKWRPYRSIGCWYLYRYINNERK